MKHPCCRVLNESISARLVVPAGMRESFKPLFAAAWVWSPTMLGSSSPHSVAWQGPGNLLSVLALWSQSWTFASLSTLWFRVCFELSLYTRPHSTACLSAVSLAPVLAVA